jgi:hypothetical protein
MKKGGKARKLFSGVISYESYNVVGAGIGTSVSNKTTSSTIFIPIQARTGLPDWPCEPWMAMERNWEHPADVYVGEETSAVDGCSGGVTISVIKERQYTQ